MIRLQDEPIDVQAVIDAVRAPERGGVAVFLGTVRNHHRERQVHELEYHAYDRLATSELESVVGNVREACGVDAIAAVHRTGCLVPGDIAVVVAAASAHRAEAFEACRQTIERLKTRVPIWKKERFEGGEVWIEGGG